MEAGEKHNQVQVVDGSAWGSIVRTGDGQVRYSRKRDKMNIESFRSFYGMNSLRVRKRIESWY